MQVFYIDMERLPERKHETATRPNIALASEVFGRPEMEAHAQELIDAHLETRGHDGLSTRETQDNAVTSIFEGLTATGHLSRLEFKGAMEEVNTATLRRLLNGWFDYYPEEEKARRFNEIVEELTVQEVWRGISEGELPSDTMVITQSNFADDLDADVAHRLGYRRLNQKGMTRAISFEQDDSGQWCRVVEQISRSNSNDHSSMNFLQARVGETRVATTDILGSQILATREVFPDGVISVQRELDQHAGHGVRYGERISEYSSDRLPLLAYEDLREGSRLRELQATKQVEDLQRYEEHINGQFREGHISYEQKLELLHTKRDAIISEICLIDPSYAYDARGEESAKNFRKASIAMAMGDHEAGQRYLAMAINTVDPEAAIGCGGVGVGPDGKLNLLGKNIYNNAKEDSKNWSWKKGICVIKTCLSAILQEETEVGPCSICRSCQNRFDLADLAAA